MRNNKPRSQEDSIYPPKEGGKEGGGGHKRGNWDQEAEEKQAENEGKEVNA